MRRAANAWDRHYRHHREPWRGERPVAPLAPWLGAGPVLELGCGNGKLLRPLARTGLRVVGLDVAWHALVRLEHPDRVLADAAVLPLRDVAFSCVLDVHCGGHLPPAGRATALAEATRVLRPGGHLVVERLGKDDLRATQGEAVPGDPDARRVADGRTTSFWDEAGLRAAGEAAGLACLRTWSERRTPRLRGVPTVRENVCAVFRKE